VQGILSLQKNKSGTHFLIVSRLIKHTVEGIRTRLDRIYLDTLNSSSGSNRHNSDNQEVNDLQEELESLYSEILPVAQMSAEQQYLEPALRSIAATNGQGQERSVKAVKYVSLHVSDHYAANSVTRYTTVLFSS
jgi:hypothetical protein